MKPIYPRDDADSASSRSSVAQLVRRNTEAQEEVRNELAGLRKDIAPVLACAASVSSKFNRWTAIIFTVLGTAAISSAGGDTLLGHVISTLLSSVGIHLGGS